MLLGNSVLFGSRGYRLFLDDDQDTGGAKAEEKVEEKPDPELEGLGDKGKETLRKIRDERDAEKQKAADLAKTVADLQKKVDAAAKKERDAQEEEAKQKGEFEQLAEKRKGELDAAKETIESLEKRLEDANTVIERIVEVEWKALPKEVQEAYTGDEEDSVKKLEWIPKAKKIVESLKGSSGSGDRRGANADEPNPGGGNRDKLEAEIEAQQARVGFMPW